MDKQELIAYYKADAADLRSQIARRRQLSRALVTVEIVSFLAIVAFFVIYTLVDWGWPLIALAVLSACAYLTARRLDVTNSHHADLLADRLETCERELRYQAGDFASFDDGARYVDASHPYTFDLDIFGPSSLYQRMCRTVTTDGADRLAAVLAGHQGWPGEGGLRAAEDRAGAVTAMAARPEWMAEFVASGVRGPVDSRRIRAAIAAMRQVNIPSWTGTLTVWIAASVGIVVFYVLVALSAFTALPSSVPVMWALLLLFVQLFVCHSRLGTVSRALGRLAESMSAYVRLLEMIRRLKTDGAPMPDLLVRKVHSLKGAGSSFREAERLMRGLDRRGNILGLIVSDVFLLADVFLLRRSLRWQRSLLEHVDTWMDTIGQIDALVSMGMFRRNEPAARMPRLVEDRGVVYEARGLYHPFLGERAVRNDFTLDDTNYYIVTGANMAGKSTFLRSLGINYVLAMCGLPVFADSLRVSAFSLFTSMRTTDDLTRGISYFNAELLRLQQLIAHCRKSSATLIILDEILKGTNSADKLNGSRLFLEHISKLRVTGVVATHDLELSRLAEHRPDRFHNYCFEIDLGTDVTYTYRVTPGVARNQNATFLLNRLLAEMDAD